MSRGLLIVHPDWPWVFHPEDIERNTMVAAENTLHRIVQHARRKKTAGVPIHLLATPKRYQNLTPPSSVDRICKELLWIANSIRVSADNLDTHAAAIAQRYPKITYWTVAGFWKDLCCADCRHGIRQTKKKAESPNSLAVEAVLA